MDSQKILFNKDGFTFVCEQKNQYKLQFNMENNNIILSKIVDFNLIKLIYDLNPDVYEKVNIEKLNENEAIVTLLMKHLFEDIGLPQKFSHIHMVKSIEERRIVFNSQSIRDRRPEDMPIDSELMAIQQLICICNLVSDHNIGFSVNVIFDQNMIIPSFAEKLVGMILHKIFKRVKLFIENVRM
jgi:hypothetical protein